MVKLGAWPVNAGNRRHEGFSGNKPYIPRVISHKSLDKESFQPGLFIPGFKAVQIVAYRMESAIISNTGKDHVMIPAGKRQVVDIKPGFKMCRIGIAPERHVVRTAPRQFSGYLNGICHFVKTEIRQTFIVGHNESKVINAVLKEFAAGHVLEFFLPSVIPGIILRCIGGKISSGLSLPFLQQQTLNPGTGIGKLHHCAIGRELICLSVFRYIQIEFSEFMYPVQIKRIQLLPACRI